MGNPGVYDGAPFTPVYSKCHTGMESCVGVAAPASPGEEDWQQQPAGVMDCQTREAVHSFPKGSSQLLEASSSSLSFDTRMKRLEDLVATLSADNQVLLPVSLSRHIVNLLAGGSDSL